MAWLCVAWKSGDAHASQRRWHCDAEALTLEESIGRVLWAWSCGIRFCLDANAREWSADQAVSACGYPVFNHLTPTAPLYLHPGGAATCHRHLHPPTGDAGAADDDGLTAWLSELVYKARCPPVADPRGQPACP